jgi:endonuclease YncB( thermonuclease family)
VNHQRIDVNSTFSFAVALFLTACAPASAAPTFAGIAKSIDGDSLYVGSREVRLFGIDAPEYHQTCTRDRHPWNCGAEAAKQLSNIVNGKMVNCVAVDTDEHGRTVARCSAGAIDINRVMVATGYATAYRHYSMDYVPVEERAKANHLGVWSGTFENPREFREDEGLSGPAARNRQGRQSRGPAFNSKKHGCVIKGNRGPHGWIYHLPGMPYYAQTRAEQMFCSEADAQAAGYRRAIVK